jgi:DUF1009 family protein
MDIVCCAIRGEASPELAAEVDAFYWCRAAQVGRMIRVFLREGVRRVVFAGKVHKVRMYAPWRLVRYMPDLLGYRIFYRMITDKKDDTILGKVVEVLGEHGLEVVGQAELCPSILAPEGLVTAGALSETERDDIAFGWRLAKQMGDLDVGQSVLVCEQSVLAVEAIEGTDACVARAGALCPKGGFTLVKVAKPKQDPRFDVPTIGPGTVAALSKAGGTVLAIEAGETILVDAAETIQLAERAGIRIVGVRGGHVSERATAAPAPETCG